MATRRLSTNAVNKEKFSLKSIFYPKFESKITENKYLLSYLKYIYPSSHHFLVLLLIIHAFINLFHVFFFKMKYESSSKIIHISLLCSSIFLNIFSLLLITRLKNRLLSNLISLICLSPLIILSCFYPMEYHVFLLIILIYTLSNFSLPLSLLISIILILILSLFTLKSKIYFILLVISNLIGIYLNRLLDITIRSAYNQLCKSKFSFKKKETEIKIVY